MCGFVMRLPRLFGTALSKRPETALFCIYGLILGICAAPDLTWINAGVDSFGNFLGARGFLTSENHVYQALGQLSLHFPFGTDGWKLAFFLSVLPAVGCVVLVFYAVRRQTANRVAPYVASIVLAGSAIFISQSTIQEVYVLATFLIVLGYTLLVHGKFRLAAAALSLAWFVNWPFAAVATLVFLASSKEILRRGWYIIVAALGLFAASFSFGGDAGYWETVFNAIGRQPVGEIPGRIPQAGTLFAVSFGLGVIPAWYYLKSARRSWPFLILIFAPVLFFLTESSEESLVQLTLSCPFVAVAAGLGVEKLQVRHLEKAVVGLSAALLLVAPAFWDIGRSIDETPTTARQFLDQLEELPDGAVITGERSLGDPGRSDWHGVLNGLGAQIVYVETGKHIEFLPTALYNVESTGEAQRLSGLGYVIPVSTYQGEPYFEWLAVIARDFVDANPDVPIYWTDVDRPGVFGCTVRNWR